MQGRELIERAVNLAHKLEEAESARAELQAIDAAVRETLAPHEGAVLEMYVGYSWRLYRIVGARLEPYAQPPKITMHDLCRQHEAHGEAIPA